jgi:diguanylate cyclase (GGDEF)-like protein
MTIRSKPLTLSLFTTLFALLYLILLFALGNFSYREFERLDRQFLQAGKDSAASEIETALVQAIGLIKVKTRQIASWQEIRLPLDNSMYYRYWQQYRMNIIKTISPHTLDAAIYDQQGDALHPTDSSLLPAHVETDSTGYSIQVRNYTPQIVVTTAVEEPVSGKKLGYLASISNLLPMLKQLRDFHYIDRDSITSTIPESNNITIQSLLDNIDYGLVNSPYVEALRRVVTQSLIQLGGSALLLTLLIFPLAAWLINRPILKISQQIDQLQSSPHSALNQQRGNPLLIKELDKIQTSLYAYHNNLTQANSFLDQKTQELDAMAQRDPLTGVMNRRAFDAYWREVTDAFKYNSEEICLILFDIDHFKALNDTYGHHTGDEVLIAIAQTLKTIFYRQEQIFRLSGDEFATILISVSPRKAMQLAKQCHLAVTNHPFNKLGIHEPVRISIGMADTKIEQGNNINALHWQADIAIHFAKRPGHSSIIRFQPELAENSRGLFSNRTHNAVYAAVTQGTGLLMHYQPIVDLQDRKPHYYEALVRIEHQGQLIMPSHIFPLVETKSLDQDLDLHVIRRIITDLRAGLIPKGTGISINISAPSIIDNELINHLGAFKPFMDNYKLLIEITETTLITQMQTARHNLEKLREMGFSIALDDFGSGYSSLRYLGAMPVDVVKFDISLTKLGNDNRDNPILSYLAKMIIESGHLLIAEGIESIKVAEQLNQLGFRYGQGYCFGRPTHPLEKNMERKNPGNYSA